MKRVTEACDRHLCQVIEILDPQYLIGVGAFAERKLITAAEALGHEAVHGKILRPSPASPAANRDFAGTAARQLGELGLW